MRLIKISKLMPLVLGLVFPVATYAQGWIKYVNEGDQFIVNFPAEPELLEVDYTTESGAIIPSRLYSVENDNGRYAITVVDYTVAEQAHVARCRRMEAELDIVSPNECRGRDHLSDVRGAIAFESWNIRRRSNGEITYDAFGQVDGVPGHQIQILHPDESRTFAALHMLDRRLYVLEGTVPGDAPPPGLFQQSLGMLDEMGRRVRFQSDAEGNFSRVQTLYEYIGEEDPVTGEPVGVFSTSNEDRIRDPSERLGIWVPEGSRADLAFLATSVEYPELFDRVDQPDVSAAELSRFRGVLVQYLRLREFAWSQYQAGILEEATLQSYFEPAQGVFASERARTEWRDGLYSGDPGFMAYMENWLNEIDGNP